MRPPSAAPRRAASADPPIRDTTQIRLLASATRQEIVDALEVAGPCTVRALAAHLGRRPDALYYHLRLLRAAELVVPVEDTGSPAVQPARAEAVYDVVLRPVSLAYEPASARNRAAVSAVVGTMLRTTERRFVRAFRPGVATVAGEARNLWAGRAQGWLSTDDLRAVNRYVTAILTLLRQHRAVPAIPAVPAGAPVGTAPENAALQEFTFVLTPRINGTARRGGTRRREVP
jgi:DNA-binding transcriptional ArsR family regulator